MLAWTAHASSLVAHEIQGDNIMSQMLKRYYVRFLVQHNSCDGGPSSDIQKIVYAWAMAINQLLAIHVLV